jgi:hypothetical protein
MKAMVSGEFLTTVYMRFVEMSKDLKSAFLNINKVS